MKKKTLLLVVCVLIIFLGLHYSREVASGGKKATKDQTWTKQMRQMSEAVSTLLPYVVSTELFFQDRNFKIIKENARNLSVYAHSLDPKRKSPDTDPSLQLIVKVLKNQTNRAYHAFQTGQRAYAQRLLKTSLNNCVGCHTRTHYGPKFKNLTEVSKKYSLNAIQRADYLTALRDFEGAVKSLESVIRDPKLAKKNRSYWQSAVKKAMVLSVRANNDANQSLKLINYALSNPHISYFFKFDAMAWRETLRKWRVEDKRVLFRKKNYIDHSVRLIQQGRALSETPSSQAALIHYLRASSILHQYLTRYPEGKYRAKAFQMLGLSYEALSSLEMSTMHELYYEMCINSAPQTKQSMECFRHLEQSMVNSGQVDSIYAVPVELEDKLLQLRKKAFPKI